MYNDPKEVYVKMVEIHQKAEDYDMVEDLYKIMTRKFKNSADVWCDYGAFKLEQADSAAAKTVLERSLAVLDKKKRASVLTCIQSICSIWGGQELGFGSGCLNFVYASMQTYR